MVGLDMLLEDSTLNPFCAMWGGERPSAPGREFIALNNNGYGCRVQHPPAMNTRSAQYVPLPDQIDSMTMFMSVLGVSSIQFNGDPRLRLGRSKTENMLPITYFFRSGEGIESVHVFFRRGGHMSGAAGLVVVVSITSKSPHTGPS
jgi:hypothetical protein